MASSSKKVCPFDHVEGRTYNCRNCRLYIASEDQIFVNQAFQAANNGQADLFDRVSTMNVVYGDARQETIEGIEYGGRNAECAGCHSTIGWQYLYAPAGPEQYRQGKVQLRRNAVTAPADADA